MGSYKSNRIETIKKFPEKYLRKDYIFSQVRRLAIYHAGYFLLLLQIGKRRIADPHVLFDNADYEVPILFANADFIAQHSGSSFMVYFVYGGIFCIIKSILPPSATQIVMKARDFHIILS